MKNYLGIDIGGTFAKMGIVREDGTLLYGPNAYPTNFDDYETPILTTVIKSAEAILSECGIEVSGIGVSAAGAINTRTGTVDGAAGHLPNYEGSRIKEDMEAKFALPVWVLNDANAAALGEMWIGGAKGKKDVVVLTVGTGIGGGIIVDGHILLGRSGFAGEIGHIPINVSGEKCYCGNTGCLEYVGATTALVRKVKTSIALGLIPPMKEVNGRTIFEMLPKHNIALDRIVKDWLFCISEGIVGLVHTFNPETVLIGGGVSAQEELFIQPIRKYVLEHVMHEFADGLEIRAAKLGNKAGMFGAVKFCMEQMSRG